MDNNDQNRFEENLFKSHVLTLQKWALDQGWKTNFEDSGQVRWLILCPQDRKIHESGWKCHLSLDPRETVGRDCFKKFLSYDTPFKIVSDLQSLCLINNGLAGITQIGKAVTFYCQDIHVAKKIAQHLHSEFDSRKAPMVMGEYVLHARSRVSLRFGSFNHSFEQDEFGRPERRINLSENHSEVDQLSLVGSSLQKMHESSFTLRKFQHLNPNNLITCQDRTLVPMMKVKSYPREIYRLIDQKKGEEFIAKRAWTGLFIDCYGTQSDKRERLRVEHQLLEELSQRGAPVCKPLGLIEEDESTILITTLAPGLPLAGIEKQIILRAAISLARALETLHGIGIVHRDLKGSNLFFDGSKITLIDFEAAAPTGAKKLVNTGTRNYYPLNEFLLKADPFYDMFAFGSILACLFLRYDISLIPAIGRPVLNMLGIMGVANEIINFIGRCWSDEPTDRPSAKNAVSFLSSMLGHENDKNLSARSTSSPLSALEISHYGKMTRAFQVKQSNGNSYRNNHMYPTQHLEGINLGSSGIILGLMTLDTAAGNNEFAADIEAASRYLVGGHIHHRSAGLFTGNAGVALALGTAGKRYGNQQWIEESKRRLASAGASVVEVDLFSGKAGVLLAAVILSHVLNEEWPLDLTINVAQSLIKSVGFHHGVLGVRASGKLDNRQGCFTGTAHGSAGIALALSQFAMATDDSPTRELALSIFKSICQMGGKNGKIYRLAGRPDLIAPPVAWCHGKLGILWAMLQDSKIIMEMSDSVEEFATDLFDGTVTSNPTYCHGLSGALETWRMLGGFPKYYGKSVSAINTLTRLILEQRQFDKNGNVVWGSEEPVKITPDLFVGSLAPATAIALVKAGELSPLLSATWLRKCVTANKEGDSKNK